jgi:hypothetical protein
MPATAITNVAGLPVNSATLPENLEKKLGFWDIGLLPGK